MEKFDVAVVGMGALGSATAYHLARRGVKTIAFEQFELGHVRGASHDTSRIIRTSYGSPEYVRLARSSYRDWAELEATTGEQLTVITGGLVFIPSDGPFAASHFADSLTEVSRRSGRPTPASSTRRDPSRPCRCMPGSAGPTSATAHRCSRSTRPATA